MDVGGKEAAENKVADFSKVRVSDVFSLLFHSDNLIILLIILFFLFAIMIIIIIIIIHYLLQTASSKVQELAQSVQQLSQRMDKIFQAHPSSLSRLLSFIPEHS